MVQTADQEFGYFQLFNILLVRRRLWFLGTLLAVLAGTVLFTITRKDTYESSMQLIVEPNFEEEYDPNDSTVQPSQQQREIDYSTQLNLMRSNELLQQAVDSISADYPNLSVYAVKLSLSLSRIKESDVETRIIRVSYKDTDPIRAQRFLQALQSVYQSYTLELQEQRLASGLRNINNQLHEARNGLIDSQAELEKFRQNQNLIDPQQQATALTNSLNQVLTEQQSVSIQYQEALAQYENVLQQIALSPESAFIASRLSQSSRFQTLLNTLQQTELALAERQVIFSNADLGTQKLIETRQNQLSLLRQEASRVLGQEPLALDAQENFQELGQLSELDLHLIQAMAEIQTTIERLTARYQSLAQVEQAIRENLNQFPEIIAEYDRLQPEVETDQEVLLELLKQRELLSAEIAKGGFTWQIVANPKIGLKIGPDLKKNLMLGTAVGLVLGGAAAFMREALDNVISTPEDLKKQITYPLLGILPNLSTNNIKKISNAVSFSKTSQTYGTGLDIDYWLSLRDSLDLIYRNIQLHRSSASAKSIAITSTIPGEGVPILSFGLALSAIRSGKSTIVVDTNFRSSTLHHWLSLSGNQGLSTLLNDQSTVLDDHSVAFEPVSSTILGNQINILPAGAELSDPVQTLSSERFQNLIKMLESRYDLVILSSPPILGTAEILEIASCCSEIIIVAQLNQITQEEIQSSLSMLRQVNVMGFVANDIPLKVIRNLKHQLFLGSNSDLPKLPLS